MRVCEGAAGGIFQKSLVDDEIELVGAGLNRVHRLESTRARRRGAERKIDDGTDLDAAAAKLARGENHFGGIDAHRGETEALRLGAQLLD